MRSMRRRGEIVTITQVKELLPAVKVDLGGRVFYASVQGRRLRKAHVMFKLGGRWAFIEERWSKVARYVSRKQTLVVELPLVEGV